MHIIALYVIDAIMILSFGLELWTGCAIGGWVSDNPIIEREKTPKRYWIVIGIQALILVASVAMVWGLKFHSQP